MLTISTWLWGAKYDWMYVVKLFNAVRRNLQQPARFVCFVDHTRTLPPFVTQFNIPDMALTQVQGCLVRMRMFDPEFQKSIGIDDRLVNFDLDAVVVRQLDPLFDRPDDFTILQRINTTNPCPYNGSLMMLRAGAYPEVWSKFSLEASRAVRFHTFPDDQGWLWHMIPNAASWSIEDGVYGFKKVGWPSGDELPANARVVAFPGWRDPSKFTKLPWVRENWR